MIRTVDNKTHFDAKIFWQYKYLVAIKKIFLSSCHFTQILPQTPHIFTVCFQGNISKLKFKVKLNRRQAINHRKAYCAGLAYEYSSGLKKRLMSWQHWASRKNNQKRGGGGRIGEGGATNVVSRQIRKDEAGDLLPQLHSSRILLRPLSEVC